MKSMSIGSYFEFPRHQDKVIDKIYIRLEHKLSMTKENYNHSTPPKILILIVYNFQHTGITYKNEDIVHDKKYSLHTLEQEERRGDKSFLKLSDLSILFLKPEQSTLGCPG